MKWNDQISLVVKVCDIIWFISFISPLLTTQTQKNIKILLLWLIIPFLFVINIFSETDCKENLIVFIVIVNVTIRRRPWSSSISAHVLVSWYYLSLVLVGRCPILITLIICIWSCIDYPQGVYLLRPPLTWQLSLERARLLVYCTLGTFCYSKSSLL